MSTAPKRRVLVVAPFPPRHDAFHGGARSIAELVSRLTSRNRVALLCLRHDGEPPVEPALEERCDLVAEVLVRKASSGSERVKRGFRVIAGVAAGRPVWVSDWASDAFARRLREIVETWRPSVVQFEFQVMAQYVSVVPASAARRVLVQHEPSLHASRALQGPRLLVPVLQRADRAAWRRFERSHLPRFAAVVTFTARDAAITRSSFPKLRIVTIPLGVGLPERPCQPLGIAPPTVLFFGSFRHPPNVEAASRLVQSIFPRVRQRCPDARLEIVGEHPPPDLRTQSDRTIAVHADVPDLRPYLERAAVVAAPLLSGGGMRVKVLETLAAGKAMVASRLAVEGLGLRDGADVLLAETDEEFADALVHVLADTALRMRIANAARAWAQEAGGWEHTAAAYEQLYEELNREMLAPRK